VPECISAKEEVLAVVGGGGTAKMAAAGAGGPSVPCAPLNDILQRYAGSAQQTIDLWILDIEGLETAVLAAPWFRDVNVDAMLVEDFWILPKPDLLDVIMGKNGFLKFQELAFDSVFVRRGHPAAQSTQPMWYPPHFDQDLAVWTQRVRNEMCPQLKAVWDANAHRKA
jgi:hypothetical protein